MFALRGKGSKKAKKISFAGGDEDEEDQPKQGGVVYVLFVVRTSQFFSLRNLGQSRRYFSENV